MDDITTTDLETAEETNPEVGAVIVVVGTVIAVTAIVGACVYTWKAIDRRLQRRYASLLIENTPDEEPKDKKKTTK